MEKSNPDYEFDAYLNAEELSPILCNIALWLPHNADENVVIEIDTPLNNIDGHIGEFVSFESEIYEENPKFIAEISKARIEHFSATMDMRKLSRNRIKLLHAFDLRVEEKINNEHVNDALTNSINFHMSNLSYAEPKVNRCASYLGARTADFRRVYSVTSPDGFTFKIEKHFSSYTKTSENTEAVSAINVLSVTAENKVNIDKLDAVQKQVDDFVLLLTFAARHQVMAIGYEYSTGTKRVRYFKNPTDRYKANQEEVTEDALIPVECFEEFMTAALYQWQKIAPETQKAIKDTIYAIHPFNNSGQPAYLTMFSAFEALVALNKTKVKTEISEKWKDIKKAFLACNEGLEVSADVKNYFQENINSLLYAEKLKTKAEAFLTDKQISVNDLWPIFDNKSLYKIRNLLAHGNRMNISPVYQVAQEQLQLLLERVVLILLGFDYNKSTAGINNHGIRRRYNQQEIKSFQNQITFD